MNFQTLLNMLKCYNQEQLLNFYKEISFIKKIKLINDIKKIDFKFMNELYKNSFFDEEIDINKISNLKCIDSSNYKNNKDYNKIGKKVVKNNEYAVVIMAGGNASRMNVNVPKGCFEFEVNNRKISLFEIFISQLKKINKELGIYINIYIMTSNSNYKKTVNFFKKKNFFNYPKKNIIFFKQHSLPILDKDGKILLKNKYRVLFGPNGNGDVFLSLKRNNLIKNMKSKNIKYILFSTVDNILTNLVDFNFIGAMISNKYNLATKTLFKEDEKDKSWVFCKYNNKPYMLPSSYINESISNMKDKYNNYMYRDTNITYHLLSIDEVEKLSTINLKYHRAFKKTSFMNLDGNIIVPEKQNSFKFERFIFDSFYYCDDMLLCRVNKDEFCPIKNDEDIKLAVEKIKNKL